MTKNLDGGLTPKQKAFADAVIAGKSAADAYRSSYNASGMSDNAIHVEASKLRKRINIDAYITAGLAKQVSEHGLTRESHVAQLTATRDAATAKGDHATALRCQEALAEHLGIKPEADDKPDGAAVVAQYRVAERCLSDDEFAIYEDLNARVTDEYTRVHCMNNEPLPVTDRERGLLTRSEAKPSQWVVQACEACGLRPMPTGRELRLVLQIVKAGSLGTYTPPVPLRPCATCGKVPLADHADSPMAIEFGTPVTGNNPMHGLPLAGHSCRPEVLTDPVRALLPKPRPEWYHLR